MSGTISVLCGWCRHSITVPILHTELSWHPCGPMILIRRPCCGRDVAMPVSESWAHAYQVAYERAATDAEMEVDAEVAEFSCLLERTDYLAELARESSDG